MCDRFEVGARIHHRTCHSLIGRCLAVRYPILRWTAKTERSHRTVPIAADVVTALKTLRAESDGSVYVFLGLDRLRTIKSRSDAGKLRTVAELVNNVLRDWKALQRRVLGPSAKVATVHDCRKAFCTHMSEVLPIQALADIVGDTPAVLMKYYTKTMPEHEAKLRNALDDGPALRLAV